MAHDILAAVLPNFAAIDPAVAHVLAAIGTPFTNVLPPILAIFAGFAAPILPIFARIAALFPALLPPPFIAALTSAIRPVAAVARLAALFGRAFRS